MDRSRNDDLLILDEPWDHIHHSKTLKIEKIPLTESLVDGEDDLIEDKDFDELENVESDK